MKVAFGRAGRHGSVRGVSLLARTKGVWIVVVVVLVAGVRVALRIVKAGALVAYLSQNCL